VEAVEAKAVEAKAVEVNAAPGKQRAAACQLNRIADCTNSSRRYRFLRALDR